MKKVVLRAGRRVAEHDTQRMLKKPMASRLENQRPLVFYEISLGLRARMLGSRWCDQIALASSAARPM